MVADKLNNLGRYGLKQDYCEKIWAFAEKCRAEGLADGRYDLDGDDLFALVQRYTTKTYAQGRMEAHRVYADVQYIMTGCERIFYGPADESVAVTEDRTPESDLVFYVNQPDNGCTTLDAGMFAIYLPLERHMPCIEPADGQPSQIEKIVFKVRV